MNDFIIEAHGLKRYYQRGNETVKALDGVDVTIRKGDCLDAPTAGTLTVAGKAVAGLS